MGEGLSGSDLNLLENITMEIGKSRPYQVSEMRLSEIDPSKLVYPICGSFDNYTCGDPQQTLHDSAGKAISPAGKNCSVYLRPHATGVCWQATFSDWDCTMGDGNAPVYADRNNIMGPQ
jgi:hypothetical protein